MKSILVGGGLGACVSLLGVIAVGAVVGFMEGVGAGHEGEKAPHTLAAAGMGAWWFLLLGAVPAGIVGLAVGAAAADVRRHRRAVGSQATFPTSYPPRRWGMGVLDFLFGLGPFLLCGLMLVTELQRLLESKEWLFLGGQVGWFTLGLVMVILGMRRLGDRFEPFRTIPLLRTSCALGAAALAIWGHLYVSQSASDPTGALKTAAYILLVGFALLLLGYLLGSIAYLQRARAREKA